MNKGRKIKYKSIYPNIQKWMDENGVTRHTLHKKYGIWPEWLSGNGNPSFDVVKKILELTGMTFEEAFKEE